MLQMQVIVKTLDLSAMLEHEIIWQDGSVVSNVTLQQEPSGFACPPLISSHSYKHVGVLSPAIDQPSIWTCNFVVEFPAYNKHFSFPYTKQQEQ